MIRPTLRQMEYLIALEDERSFSSAADICNVTQSTLGAGIRELENILDQPLVNRGQRKNITLTTYGTEVSSEARKILEDTDKLTARAKHMKAPMSGPLRLGVIPTIAPYFLPTILPTIKKNFPDLELELHEDLSDRLIEHIKKGTLDMVLMAFPFETPDMSQMILFKEPFLLASPKEHTPHTKPLNTSDIDPCSLLLLEDGHCLSDHAITACGLQKPSQRKAYSATSLQTLIQLVGHNYGMTLLPQMAIHGLPDTISLTAFNDPKPTRDIGLAWRHGHPRRTEFETLGKAMINKKPHTKA
ncbi:MAG: LysR substrate-binding domain-containing protein [Alphaproteobacteria bacterium]